MLLTASSHSSPTCGFLIALYSQQQAGNSAIAMKAEKQKVMETDSSKGAKLQDKQHNVAT